MRRISVVVAALLLLTGACGGDDDDDDVAATTSTKDESAEAIPSTGPFDGLVSVGDHKLHLVCDGTGAPAAVIEMGAGQRVSAWNGTQPELAETRRTCVYERAGTGTSEPGPEPRTSQVIADELATLLEAADLAPVIIVSHSIGGLHAHAFAQRHPDKVAGLVFLDPRTAEYQLAYRELLSEEERARDEHDEEQAIANEPFGPEIAAFDDSARAVVDAGDLPDVPVIVLTAGVTFPGQPQADIDLWRSAHEHLAAEVSHGEASVVEGAEHEIWRSHTQEVVDAVAEIDALLRT